jgi:hypothetical protein
MAQKRTAPPAAEECLTLSYASRGPRGGSLIAESVVDVAEHERRMQTPDSYRPSECRCGCRKLHIHGRRERKMVGSVAVSSPVQVLVFLCVACRATWRVLPAFLARCLWRAWKVVERVIQGTQRPHEPHVPDRTVRRWRARLHQTARLPAQVLATSGSILLREVAQAVGLDGNRQTLAMAYATSSGGSLLAPLAALLHRLCPGVRLM